LGRPLPGVLDGQSWRSQTVGVADGATVAQRAYGPPFRGHRAGDRGGHPQRPGRCPDYRRSRRPPGTASTARASARGPEAVQSARGTQGRGEMKSFRLTCIAFVALALAARPWGASALELRPVVGLPMEVLGLLESSTRALPGSRSYPEAGGSTQQQEPAPVQ